MKIKMIGIRKLLNNKLYIFWILFTLLAFFLLLSNYYENSYIEHCPENRVAYSWDVYDSGVKKISECSKPLNCPKGHSVETQCSNLKHKNEQGEEYYGCGLYCRKEGGPPIF